MPVSNVVDTHTTTTDAGNSYRFRIGDVRNEFGTVSVNYEWDRVGGDEGGYIGGVDLVNSAGEVLASDEIGGGITGARVNFGGTLSASASPGETLRVVLATDLMPDLSFEVPQPIEFGDALDLRVEKNNEGPYSRAKPLDYTVYVENLLPEGAGEAQFDVVYPIGPGDYPPQFSERTYNRTLAPGERLEIDVTYPQPEIGGEISSEDFCIRVDRATVAGESIDSVETCIDFRTEDPPEPDPEPPEPDPEPPEPTVPPTEVSCDYDGSEIVAGESVTIPATVTAGSGDTDTSVTVRFEVAGAAATESVTLSPGGAAEVEASFELVEPGEYQPTVTLE